MLTKITKYRTEGRKRATAHTYRRKIRSALLSLARNVILCNTPEHVDAAAALAQAVSSEGMNNRNYLLFLTLLETNHPYVIDILVGPRNPFLLFSPIKPNWFLVKETFRILAKFKGNELAVKALLALLGVVQNAYKTSKDGYKIYPLRMSDVYNIGKHLDTEQGPARPAQPPAAGNTLRHLFRRDRQRGQGDKADRDQGERHPHGILRQHEAAARRDSRCPAREGHRARARSGTEKLPVDSARPSARPRSRRREEPEVEGEPAAEARAAGHARTREKTATRAGNARRQKGFGEARSARGARENDKCLTTSVQVA